MSKSGENGACSHCVRTSTVPQRENQAEVGSLKITDERDGARIASLPHRYCRRKPRVTTRCSGLVIGARQIDGHQEGRCERRAHLVSGPMRSVFVGYASVLSILAAEERTLPAAGLTAIDRPLESTVRLQTNERRQYITESLIEPTSGAFSGSDWYRRGERRAVADGSTEDIFLVRLFRTLGSALACTRVECADVHQT